MKETRAGEARVALVPQGVKTLLDASFSATLETQMEFEARAIAAMAGTPDGKEGIQAFLEKRRPAFSGR